MTIVMIEKAILHLHQISQISFIFRLPLKIVIIAHSNVATTHFNRYARYLKGNRGKVAEKEKHFFYLLE
jgi:hypothetical protein